MELKTEVILDNGQNQFDKNNRILLMINCGLFIVIGSIISRLHACAIRIFWNRYVSERNICIVGRLAVSFHEERQLQGPRL